MPMALAPMAVPWILGLAHPELYQVAIRAANFEQVSEHGLFLLLGAFTAIFGTHTINTLRTEAYEARLLEPVSAGPQARRRRNGRGLPGGASVAQAALRDQADPPRAGRAITMSSPASSARCARPPSSRTGTRSRSSTTAATTTARSTT